MKKTTTTKPSFSILAKSKVGLDIGTHSIKVVEIQGRHGMRVLKNLGIKEIPILYRGEAKKDIASIARLIKELFAERGIKNKEVVLAIHGSKVSIKVIKVPKMPKSELREAVKWEMRRHVQFPVEDAVLDYSILGTVMEGGLAKIKLIVAAAAKSAVNEQLAIIKEAGLQLKGIDAAPFAVCKAFAGAHAPPSPSREEDKVGVETIVLVDIGYRWTNISLITDNVLQFARDAKIGGNSFTEALLALIRTGDARVGLEYDEAEGLKSRYGIQQWDSSETAEEKIPLSQIYVTMRPVLEKLMVEIGRSFDFFVSQLNVSKINKIILSGGGAKLKGLPELLAQRFKMDVEVANPFENIVSAVKDAEDDVWFHEMSPKFAVAAGLALTAPEGIDLTPQEVRLKRQSIMYGTVFAVSSFILLCIFANLYWNTNKQLSVLQRELFAKRSQLSNMEISATKLPQLMELREKVKREKNLLPKESFERYPWTEIMVEISNAIPPRAMLTSLSVETEASKAPPVGKAAGEHAIQRRKLTRLKGIIFDKDPEDRIGLNNFIRFMEVSPFFTNVSLVFTQDMIEYEQAGKYFEFVCVPVSGPKR